MKPLYCLLVKVAGGRVMAGCEGKLTCNHCSNRLKNDKLLHNTPDFVCGYTAQIPSAVSGTVLGKSIDAGST